MKLISANLKNLQELYVASLQKSLDMEREITEALPTMIEKSTDPALKQGFEQHLSETETHVQRLESILQDLTGEISTQKCKVISALVSEAEDMIKDSGDESIRDVSLIAAGQQVEHHEIAVYGTLRTWAELLGREQDVELLQQTLKEEKNADALLTQAADQLNSEASLAA